MRDVTLEPTRYVSVFQLEQNMRRVNEWANGSTSEIAWNYYVWEED